MASIVSYEKLSINHTVVPFIRLSFLSLHSIIFFFYFRNLNMMCPVVFYLYICLCSLSFLVFIGSGNKCFSLKWEVYSHYIFYIMSCLHTTPPFMTPDTYILETVLQIFETIPF